MYSPPKINKVVAIKRIFEGAQEQKQRVQGFFTEVESLIRCKHHNIVSLLGFSREDGEHILVYEYTFNGSLADYLGGNGNMLNLTWGQRIQICLDIAHGIDYLHTNMEEKPMIIHRDIKSANILLDENLKAKIADFGLSKVHPMKQETITIHTDKLAGTKPYIDPEYMNSGRVKRETDIYSFGVVLFEVLSGSLAYDTIYLHENRMGHAPIARQRFEEGRIEELINPKLPEKDNSTLNVRLNQDYVHVFSKIAYQCLAETQHKRPTKKLAIKELHNAFNLQAGYKLNEILSATYNFSDEKLITKGALGEVYEGQLLRNGTLLNFTVRRLDCKYGQGDELKREISMLQSLKHKNIISILGHYDENNEKIIIYEQAFRGTLNRRLSDPTLTWSQRLYMFRCCTCSESHPL
ncbi:putative serine/threonine-protein kinase PBL28 isoform X1 [Bidens hawaiensis]|uniref:putative serine/threonine-protein kinase PBL28 isoform X1 n=1 Tax=Bidens hawaiensis TaxID=980011 RepID=UPI0040494F37